MELVNDEGFREFIGSRRWQFAKTMAEIPHEYTVAAWYRDRVGFEAAVSFIRKHGYVQKFFRRDYIYYDVDGFQYWTMGDSVEDTAIINRALKKS